MDVDPDVALVGYEWLAGMDPHAHAKRVGRERKLSVPRRSERVARPRKGEEERVALRVDLDAPVSSERRTERASVGCERLGVPVAKLLQLPRRPFDVREEERDGAARKSGHNAMM